MIKSLMMKTKLKTRNSQIAERVLLGEATSTLSDENKLSLPRIRQIVIKYCWERNREAYTPITKNGRGKQKLNLLRDSAELFVKADEGRSGLEQSLYTIEELSSSVVNSLRPEGILTVGELLKFDNEQLKRTPNIGVAGMRQIREFKEKQKLG